MKTKGLFYLFMILTLILSHSMCAVVAYNYCSMQWNIQYNGYSAPASSAFFLMIPYLILIMLCLILAYFFYKKQIK